MAARRESDLLFWAPVAFRDLRTPTLVKNIPAPGKYFMVLRALKKYGFDKNGKATRAAVPRRLDIDCVDSVGGKITVSVFGATKPWVDIEPGHVIAGYGDVKVFGSKLVLTGAERFSRGQIGHVAPTYSAIRGKVSREKIAVEIGAEFDGWIDSAALDLSAEYPELDEDQARNLLRRLHRPATLTDGEEALSEAKEVSAKHALMRGQMMRDSLRSSRLSVIAANVEAVMGRSRGIPSLTGDQKTAIAEIVADLRSGLPMRRLLSGDVGTGKTLGYLIPIVAAQAAGALVGVLMPNQLLVDQLVEEASHFFPGVPFGKVTSTDTVDQAALAANPILVGTTALSSFAAKKKLQFSVVVCDEQHKLSRQQRETLVLPHTNLLEATATAIPRSMALITHGGMDISILRESPVQKRIVSEVCFDEERVETAVAEVLASGGQAAIVYSMVESSDREGAEEGRSVVESARWWEEKYPGRVAVVHGQLPDDEKIAALNRMKRGEAEVLVASTAIEVGVTIPNLKMVAVVDADRHGVAGLHQLRGRVARKGGEGRFLMCAPAGDSLDEEAKERLLRVAKISDGFALAEADMEARGFGDLAETSREQAGSTGLLFPSITLRASEISRYAENSTDNARREMNDGRQVA